MLGPPKQPALTPLDAEDIEILGRLPGVTQEHVAEARALLKEQTAQEPVCEIWPENWEVFRLFCSLDAQWTHVAEVYTKAVVGMGVPIVVTRLRRESLPSDRVESHLRLKGVARSRWPLLFADLELMAEAVLQAESERLADQE